MRTRFPVRYGLSYRSLQWLVFLCFALHNLEEGLTIGAYLPETETLAREIISPGVAGYLPAGSGSVWSWLRSGLCRSLS
jgi:hypothetical protein